MTRKSCTDDEFIKLFSQMSGDKVAELLGVNVRNVYKRRRRIEERLDTPIISRSEITEESIKQYPNRMPLTVLNGVVFVGGDAHVWPGERSTAFRGFCFLAREFGSELKAVINNGDFLDFAKISRFPDSNWRKVPKVNAEVEVVRDRLLEIKQSSGNAELLWDLGNHDFRFEARLIAAAPDYEGVPGFALKDHFPEWRIGISTWINNNTVVKHRFKGGIHATHNNALWAGKNIVTNHLHSLKCTPLTDYNGTRYGVDAGAMAEIIDAQEMPEQFDYNEDNPANHRGGFAVLTYHNGKLLMPELAKVFEKDKIEFRGKVYSV